MAKKTFALLALAAVIAAALILPGCVSTSEDQAAAQQPNGGVQNAAPQNLGDLQGRNYTGPRGNYTGPRGNFTGDRNFSNQFMQEAIAACSGKAQGDNCTVTNTRGEMPGNCETRNATLECRPQFANRTAQAPPQPYAQAPPNNSG